MEVGELAFALAGQRDFLRGVINRTGTLTRHQSCKEERADE
jgi:hypothetical protein